MLKIHPKFKSSSNPNKMERNFYQTWKNIQYRCSDRAKGNNRKRYFNRGIKVCKRWNIFDRFYDDMWYSYKLHCDRHNSDTEIDRIDNDAGYSKKNCRWSTHKENSNNRSSQRLFNGKTLTQWASILGIKRSTLAQRFYVYNWSIDKTLLIK